MAQLRLPAWLRVPEAGVTGAHKHQQLPLVASAQGTGWRSNVLQAGQQWPAGRRQQLDGLALLPHAALLLGQLMVSLSQPTARSLQPGVPGSQQLGVRLSEPERTSGRAWDNIRGLRAGEGKALASAGLPVERCSEWCCLAYSMLCGLARHVRAISPSSQARCGCSA
ncbi:unnamed protein product [Polarella glacialis]|uniref:Uncharacterized protein n=1 Tax=Polarella glacialis TaxID=89957 RepID=A0A813FLV4_POLGL|nr:unnamed protein product [Polarella glacialis]